MINTTAISVLRTFSKNEIREFDKFINSEFFNSQPSITRFYGALREHYPGFSGAEIERKKIFSSLYPEKPYSDDTVRRLTSDLKKIIDNYIYFKAQENNTAEARFLKAFEYIRRGLVKEAEKELEQINKEINKSPLISNEYIKNRLEYEDLTVQIHLSKNKQELAEKNFLNETEFLIYHFVLRLAYYIHNIKANKVIFNITGGSFVEDFVQSIDFGKINGLIKSGKFQHKAGNSIGIYVLALLNNIYYKEEKYYFELKELLGEVIADFSDTEKYNIYQVAEALCWGKMETINREKYRRELFELNKMRLEAGVFSPDGKVMRVMLYKQIFNTAMQLKELEWAKEFTEEYSGRLPENMRENLKAFSYANLMFEGNDFDGSLRNLNKIDVDNFVLKYDTRNLLLRIYIELNYIEEAISLIDSYRHFLSNNKNVSGYYREITNNFLKYCKHIIDLKNGRNKLQPEEIQAELENENAVNFKSWLLEKLGGK